MRTRLNSHLRGSYIGLIKINTNQTNKGQSMNKTVKPFYLPLRIESYNSIVLKADLLPADFVFHRR